MELQRGSAGSYGSPISINPRRPNASVAEVQLTLLPDVVWHPAVHSDTRTHTMLQLSCLFKYNFSSLDQCCTPQSGHPPICTQGQERAQRGHSALTGSYYQDGGFASSRRATLWPCLCLPLQSLLQTLIRWLCSPALPLTCFVAKGFPRKPRRRVRNLAHKRAGCLNLSTETAYFCWSSRVMQSVLKDAVSREGQQVFCLIMFSNTVIFLGLKKKIRNKKARFRGLCRPVLESCDITFHVFLLVRK